ncbi:MAG TPA: hypothetical protein VMC85_17980 [Desulfomonilaceae bacterium]|nr:hypothetical protein [Desulfomonilaceae bacterium]HVN80291.1 hypothetical protein [Terriglobia bacterium]
MLRFEYEISTHLGNAFTKLAYICSQAGECSLEEVPGEEPQILVDLMNERGLQGWELIQLVSGKQGLMAFWKRRLISGGIA